MVKVSVTGCLHGELDRVSVDIASAEKVGQFKTDLVLCCGDLQSVRNPGDLASMSIPTKYHGMGDFWKYYAEEMKAPIPTVFIGGNHEASSFLHELPYGRWMAPNIWYMGYAGVVQFAGLRIAGLSGMYKQHDFTMGHYERPPYSESTKRSAYHIRNLEVFRLGQLRRRLDIVLSHDWPRGIYHYGNTGRLLQHKRHFREEIDADSLGGPPATTNKDCQEHDERYTSFSLNSSLERPRPSQKSDETGGSHRDSSPADQLPNNNSVDYLQLLSPVALSSESPGVGQSCCHGDESTPEVPAHPPAAVCYPQLMFSPTETNNNNNMATSSSTSVHSGGQYLIAIASPHAYINQPGGQVMLRQSPSVQRRSSTAQQQQPQGLEEEGREEEVQHRSGGVSRASRRATSNVYVEEDTLGL